MNVRHRIFESSSQSWADLCADVGRFATEIGRERLINISVATDRDNARRDSGTRRVARRR